jgi:hypothetical protein
MRTTTTAIRPTDMTTSDGETSMNQTIGRECAPGASWI